jgi:hypothetical protein
MLVGKVGRFVEYRNARATEPDYTKKPICEQSVHLPFQSSSVLHALLSHAAVRSKGEHAG